MKVIDAHVHLIQTVAGTGERGELRSLGKDGRAMYADGTVIDLIPPFLGGDCVTPETVLSVMDENDVEKAVLLQGNYYGFQNHYTYEAAQKYPDRFLPAAMYDPFSKQKDAIRRHLFEELKIPVVKFEVSVGSGLMCNHDFRLDGPEMADCADYADQLGNVFVIDIGKCGSASWQVPELRRLILAHPHMKFVVCHLLACSRSEKARMEEGVRMLALPNVWFDLAAVTWNCRPDAYPYPVTMDFITAAGRIAGFDRLMFATDLPSACKRDTYAHYIQMFTESPLLTEEQKRLILHDAAQDVYFS